MIAAHLALFESALNDNDLRRGRQTPFHPGLRLILEKCWPEFNIDQQLERTWFTNAVLCSLPTGAEFTPGVEDACVLTYLKPQIERLSNAYVLALGGKARARLKRNRVRMDGWAQHPSARPVTNPQESWSVAAQAFRYWLARH
jgi:hypothetical protein